MLYHCFASFKQLPLEFFMTRDSYSCYCMTKSSSVGFTNYICAVGVTWQKKWSWEVWTLAYKMCQCTVLLKDEIIVCNVSPTSVMLSILTSNSYLIKKNFHSWQIPKRWHHGRYGDVCETGSWMPYSPFLVFIGSHIALWM